MVGKIIIDLGIGAVQVTRKQIAKDLAIGTAMFAGGFFLYKRGQTRMSRVANSFENGAKFFNLEKIFEAVKKAI